MKFSLEIFLGRETGPQAPVIHMTVPTMRIIFFPAQDGLEECNGGDLNAKFVYFVTNVYPFVGRCLWVDIAEGFGTSMH